MTIENMVMYPGSAVLSEPQPIIRTRNFSGDSTGSYRSSSSYGSGSSYSTVASTSPDHHQNQQKSVNPMRYKTELCRPFEESGYCKYGEKCQFSHGTQEVRSLSRHPKYKTELCRTYHTVGFCPYGPRCHFIHNEDELKLTEINHMKHQQVLKHVAQQVVQQQALSQLALQQQHQHQSHKSPPMSSGGQLMSFLDTSSSVTDSSPSLSPMSLLGDEVFTGVTTPPGAPTPPPGFSVLPGTSNAGVFNFPSLSCGHKSAVPSAPSTLLDGPDPVSSLTAGLQAVFVNHPAARSRREVMDTSRDSLRSAAQWPGAQSSSPMSSSLVSSPLVSTDRSNQSVCQSPLVINNGLRLPIFSHFAVLQI